MPHVKSFAECCAVCGKETVWEAGNLAPLSGWMFIDIALFTINKNPPAVDREGTGYEAIVCLDCVKSMTLSDLYFKLKKRACSFEPKLLPTKGAPK